MNLKTYIKTGKIGDAAKLAAALGISPSYLSQLASGKITISATYCVAIEQATKGAVTRKDLHANWERIWPELAEKSNAPS